MMLRMALWRVLPGDGGHLGFDPQLSPSSAVLEVLSALHHPLLVAAQSSCPHRL